MRRCSAERTDLEPHTGRGVAAVHWGNARLLRQQLGRTVKAEMRWPQPEGRRPAERLLVAALGGLAFVAVFHALLHLAAVFASGAAVSLFFPIAGLCFLFGYLFGPVYLPVPILAVLGGDALVAFRLDPDTAMHITRQAVLYGGAGVLLRRHRLRRPRVGSSARLGALLVATLAAATVNLVIALAIFARDGALAPSDVSTVAMVFFLGDASGLLLVVPPALLLTDRLLERRRRRPGGRSLGWRDLLVAAGLVALALIFVLGAVLAFDDEVGVAVATTPALLPILIGAMLFGYAMGVSLFSVAAVLLLATSAVLADAPSAVALQTVLIVCCMATLTVGAATDDRVALIARLDAAVAERTRQLDAKNAALTRSNAELRKAAVTDHLTGLGNRRAFEEEVERRLAGPSADTGLLLLDIDRFKRINDQHGHATGDQALIHVARLLEAGLRDGDHLARIGGEEFAVVCTVADPDELRDLAERLRRMVPAVALRPSETSAPISISVSVGGALARPGDDLDRLLLAADRALYAAKDAGRDRSRIARPPEVRQVPAASG
jgi:diguanylate cyclase (GGDEF)-like protein